MGSICPSSTSLAFTFPSVLRKVVRDDKVRSDACRTLIIPDGVEMIRRYFREMTAGAEYERQIHGDWNTYQPDILLRRNFETAKLIASMGWSSNGVADLIEQPIPGLPQVPPTADLFLTSDHDAAAATALAHLDKRRGIEAANATKLLYQKRPAYIPILDDYARRALCLPWVRTGGYEAILRRFRDCLSTPGNHDALLAIKSRLSSDPSITQGLSLSSVRIVDVLAWGALRFSDHFST